MKKTIFAFVFMLALALPMTVRAASADKFTDVKPGDWYYEAVDYAVTEGLFNGTSPTAFSPDGTMTRGMFVTVLGRLAKVPENYGAGRENPFTDIRPGDYFYPYTLWAVDNGITSGTGNREFSPHANVNREQIAVLLHRYFQKFGFALKEQESPFGYFPDSGEASGFAADALKWATAYGVIGGSDGKLEPAGIAARCQVAQMLWNFSKIGEYPAGGGGGDPAPSPSPEPDKGPDKDPDNTPEPAPTPKPWENYNPTYILLTGKSPVDENGGYYDYDLANEIFRQVNGLRSREGLGALERNPVVEKWAAIRAKECNANFAHTRPDGTSCFTVGTKIHSENLLRYIVNAGSAANFISSNLEACAEQLASGWYNSDGHRINMLNRTDSVTGVAVYVKGNAIYATQLFSQQSHYYFDVLAPKTTC